MKITNFRNPQSNFTIIDNRIINDVRLTPVAFRLYCYIKSKPETWSFSCARIAKCLELNDSTVQTHLKLLQKYGYFDRHFESLIEGRGKEAIYTIYDYDKAKYRFDNGLIGKAPKKEQQDDDEITKTTFETKNNAPATPKVKYPNISEEKDANIQMRLCADNMFETFGDDIIGFTKDDFIEWLEYLSVFGKVSSHRAEMQFKELMKLGENAKKAIDNSILKGLKYPCMPFENTKTQSTSSPQQKSKYYEAGEENEITRAGITLRYNPKLLNSKIGNNDYEGEFWGIVRAFDLDSYELRTKYKDFSIDSEVREYINEAITQRIEFLKKRQTYQKTERKTNYMEDLL